MKSKLVLYAFAAIGMLSGGSVCGQSYAVTNAKIVTVSGATIEKGTVVVRDGLIQAVGANAAVPADAQVFDGNGLTVYPGFIDSLSNLGLAPRAVQAAGPVGGGGGGQAAAAAAAAAAATPSNSNYPAGLRPEYATLEDIRAGDAQFESARNAGFTTALSTGRTGIFTGQSVLINLAGDNVSVMTVKSPVAMNVAFVTIPGQYPGSLLGTFSALRQMFNDAKRHDQLLKMYAQDPRGMRRPADDKSLEALIPVVNGQMPVILVANRENEIERALNLAKEYNLKAIIAGGQDAGKFIGRLKSQNVPVLLSMNFPKRTAAASPDADPESLDLLRFRAEVPKVAGKLAAAGVKFAFQNGGAADVNDFVAAAVKSTENGLSKDAAIKAMTLAPAEIFGVSDRMGSIETGKIANLTVVRGDLFSAQKTVTHVFVDGKPFEIKAPEVPAGRGPGGRGQGAGAGTGGGANPSALPSVGGTYSINIAAPGQALTGTLTLTQQSGQLTGSMTTDLGSGPIRDGKVTQNGFSFAGSVNFGGQSIDFTVQATVTGNTFSGTVDSPQGAIPISGTKNP
ncbi:MAG: amidohydrolase family protein [Pyrinomonadaceae bacterium]